jgi:glycosyltransferase involved in cell wall biosynthesis
MNILMISDVYFPRVNGVSTSIQTYRRDLQALGHRCVLVAPQYPGKGVDDDADLLRIASRGVPRDPEDRMLSRRTLLAQSARFAREDFDVVHVQTPFVAHYAGIELARRLGVPVVESYHTYFEHYLHHYVPALPRALLQYVARRFTVSQCHQVNAVISPSGQMAEALRAYGVSTAIEVLPTGLPPGRFAPGNGARFRLRHGIASQRPIALFVGRVAHEKNIDFLIRMLPQLRSLVPDILLVIAGEGPALGHCRQLVEQLGLAASVHFVGYMDRDTELLDCYRAADTFVFASRTETQGLVLLEAMAQGTPVVSTAVMGTVDVLSGAGGAVVVPEDAATFACGVAAVLHDPARRAELSERATADAQRWSSQSLAERLVRVYESVIDARSVTGGSSSGRGVAMTQDQTRVA